jgi:outer membrane protein assembly factor BamB
MLSLMDRLHEELDRGLSLIRERRGWPYPQAANAKNWVTSVHACDIDEDGEFEILACSRDGRCHFLTREGLPVRNLDDSRNEIKFGGNVWQGSIVGTVPSQPQKVPIRIIVGGYDGKIYALDREGNPWIWPEGASGYVRADFPRQSASERVNYFSDTQRSILQVHVSRHFPDCVVFASQERGAFALDLLTGKFPWHFSTGNRVYTVFSCDLYGDNCQHTLVGSRDHFLYVLDSQGREVDRHDMKHSVLALCAEDIDGDGQVEILVGTRARTFTALTPDLREKWTRTLSSRVLAMTVADIDNDGQQEILVSTADKYLYLFDAGGNLLWRQNRDTRIFCLYAIDLDGDGRVSILAGSQDNQLHCLSIQKPRKGLEARIRRTYAALGSPAIETLPRLDEAHRSLLRGIVRPGAPLLEKDVHLRAIEALLATGEYSPAFSRLLKLQQQKVQLFWEKKVKGYLDALCFRQIAGTSRQDILIGNDQGLLSAFDAAGSPLWSKQVANGRISDLQTGCLSHPRRQDIVGTISSSSPALFILQTGRKQSLFMFLLGNSPFSFYLLTPEKSGPAELFLEMKNKELWHYTGDLPSNLQSSTASPLLSLPAPASFIHVSQPLDGSYRSPEILVSTYTNQVIAYDRKGRRLWDYPTYDDIQALSACDIDEDGRLEVLIGSRDRHIYVLNEKGHLLWRYFLDDAVLCLEMADLDGDGKQEILVGCNDGLLVVFDHTGNRLWHYQAPDRIQALRVADLNADGDLEIALAVEDRLQLLQVVNQKRLEELIACCWDRLLARLSPEEVLLSLLCDPEPERRAFAIRELTKLQSLPPNLFVHFAALIADPSPDVRKTLARAISLLYSTNPSQARLLLDQLIVGKSAPDHSPEVRIAILESIHYFIQSHPDDALELFRHASNTRGRIIHRAAVRSIRGLIDQASPELMERLFRVLLDPDLQVDSEQISSSWVRQEAGTVLAYFLDKQAHDFFFWFYHLLASHFENSVLHHIEHNLQNPQIYQAFRALLALCSDLSEKTVREDVSAALSALEPLRDRRYGLDTWTMYRELQALLALENPEELAHWTLTDVAAYSENPLASSFVHVLKQLHDLQLELRLYLAQVDANDRFANLQKAKKKLYALQRFIDDEYRDYELSPDLPPREPECRVLRLLCARWQNWLETDLHWLRADLDCEFLTPHVPREPTVGIWLKIANRGRGPAQKVKVKVLPSAQFEPRDGADSCTFETISANREVTAEFLIQPRANALDLIFEIRYYDDPAESLQTITFPASLGLIERARPFTHIPNPYNTGTPIRDEQMFYGREKELKELREQVLHTTGQSVLVLYGQRRSGKTTLLWQLRNIALRGEHIPVMVDMQRLTYGFTVPKFFFSLSFAIADVLRQRGCAVPLPAQEDFHPDATFTFNRFLDTVEQIISHRKLILLLDEFEEFEALALKGKLEMEFFRYWRSLIQDYQYIHFLLSGTRRLQQLTRDYWEAFFNITRLYHLQGGITRAGAEGLITRPVAGYLEYEEQAITKIHQLTADRPYLIHLLCSSIVNHCNDLGKNYVTLPDINQVVDGIMQTGTGQFEWVWKQLDDNEQILLAVIAGGNQHENRPLSLEDIEMRYRQLHLPYHRDVISGSLNVLKAADVIEFARSRSGQNIYEVPIGLLRQWLNSEHPVE